MNLNNEVESEFVDKTAEQDTDDVAAGILVQESAEDFGYTENDLLPQIDPANSHSLITRRRRS